jgi:hypothetical protein
MLVMRKQEAGMTCLQARPTSSLQGSLGLPISLTVGSLLEDSSLLTAYSSSVIDLGSAIAIVPNVDLVATVVLAISAGNLGEGTRTSSL